MKKASLKTLAILLALCMVVAMVPVTALATALGSSQNVQAITIGEKTVTTLTGTAESATEPTQALEGTVELDEYAGATLKVKLEDGKTLETDGKMKYYVGETCTTVNLSDDQGTDLTDDVASSDLSLSKGKYIWIYVKPNEGSAEYIKITVTLKKTTTPTFSQTEATCTDTTNKSVVFTVSSPETFNSKGAAFKVYDSTGSTEQTSSGITAEYDNNGNLTLKNSSAWTGENNQYTVKATIGDHPESDASAVITVKAKKSDDATLASASIKGVSASSLPTPITDGTSADLSSSSNYAEVTVPYETASDTSTTSTFTATADGKATVTAYTVTGLTEASGQDVTVEGTTISGNTAISSESGGETVWVVVKVVSEDAANTNYYVFKVTVSPATPKLSDNDKITAMTVGGGTVTVSSAQGTGSTSSPEDLGSVEVPYAQMANATVSVTTQEEVEKVEVSTTDPTSGWQDGTQLTKGDGNTYTGTIALTGKTTLYVEVTAKDTTTKAYYKVTITEKKAKPQIQVTPTQIDTGTASPELTITITNGADGVEFADSLESQSSAFVLADTGTSLTVESVSGSGTTATLKLTGTAAEGSFTLTVKNAAFKNAEGDADSVTVTVSTPAPVTPSTPSTTVTQPATDTEGGTTTVDVNTRSTTSGTTAKATVSSSSMSSAVNSALNAAEKAGTDPVVEVKVTTSSSADTLNVTLPAASLEKLAEAEDASLVITSDIAEVALDNTALTALTEGATGNTVTLEVTPQGTTDLSEAQADAVGDAPVVDVSLLSGGEAIHDYKNGIVKVTLPYTLADGQEEDDVVVYYLGDDGALTACETAFAGGKVTFTTVHLSKYVIGDGELGQEKDCPSLKLSDLDNTAWYHEYTDYVLKADLMHGHDDGSFKPADAVTRAEMVTVLWNLAEDPVVNFVIPFTDVKEGEWYAEAIRWAASEGIVDGYDDGTFKPDQAVTREELAVMLCRYEKKVNDSYTAPAATALEEYPDAAGVSDWAVEAVAWCVENDIVTGDDGRLDPAGEALREQLAAILTRYDKLAK